MKDSFRSCAALSTGAVRALARRPGLWPEALRQWTAFCPRRWWAGWPPLPVPARAYLSFRREAMFGSSRGELGPAELVGYLEWCRRMRALVR